MKLLALLRHIHLIRNPSSWFIFLEVYFLMDPWEYGDLSLVLPHDPQHASTLYPVSSTPTFPHSIGTAHGRCSSGQISWYRTNLGGQIILLIENLLNTQPPLC